MINSIISRVKKIHCILHIETYRVLILCILLFLYVLLNALLIDLQKNKIHYIEDNSNLFHGSSSCVLSITFGKYILFYILNEYIYICVLHGLPPNALLVDFYF